MQSRELFDNYKYVPDDNLEQDYELVIECMKKEMNTLNPYEKMLIEEKIIQGKSYNYINQKYNIHNGHLLRDIKRIVKQIRTKCEHCFDL
jgi:DNA-directed RNA polymerase specialized sigma subunit